MIIMKQLSKMVVMIMSEKSGCTRMWMATRRTGLKGESTHRASAAENRKMSLPFEMTMNVCNDRKAEGTASLTSLCQPWVNSPLMYLYIFPRECHVTSMQIIAALRPRGGKGPCTFHRVGMTVASSTFLTIRITRINIQTVQIRSLNTMINSVHKIIFLPQT